MEQPDPPGIETFFWRGQKRYRCNLKWESGDPCAYNTFDLQELRDHLTSPHTYTGKHKKLKAIVEKQPSRERFQPPATPEDYQTTAEFKK